MTSRQRQLVELLLTESGSLGAQALAGKIGVSVRTVHNYIRAINDQAPGTVSSTPGGYAIDRDRAAALLAGRASDGLPQDADERCSYVLTKLARSEVPLSVLELCEELYIGTTTFQSLMGRMRQATRSVDLRLRKEGDLIRLEGTEHNKRRLLSALMLRESENALGGISALQAAYPYMDVAAVCEDLKSSLSEHGYYINDFALMNLLLHVVIAVDRVRSGFPNQEVPAPEPELNLGERRLAHTILDRLEARFGFVFTQADAYEIALLLVTRATAVDFSSVSPEQVAPYIGEDEEQLVRQLISTVYQYCQISLTQPEFYVRFSLHVHNLLARARAGSLCKNPLSLEIKRSCPLIFDVATVLAGVILERCGLRIDEDEVAFLALHLGSALEERIELMDAVPIALFCPEYYGLAANVAQAVARKLGGRVALASVATSEAQLQEVDADILVVATVRPQTALPKRLVVISPFVTREDVLAIERHVAEAKRASFKGAFKGALTAMMGPELFMVVPGRHGKGEVIHFLCERLSGLGIVDGSFEADVLQREEISTSAYGQFAIVRSLKMRASRTAMCVYMSETPIEWDGSEVRLVIMFCVSVDEQRVFYDVLEPLTSVLLDSNNLRALLSARDYESFVKCLSDLAEND